MKAPDTIYNSRKPFSPFKVDNNNVRMSKTRLENGNQTEYACMELHYTRITYVYYNIGSTSVLLENERMKLLILYTIHSGIVHSTNERRISSFNMKRADEAPIYMYYT